MGDLERIARAIWSDRAARILAEDIAAQREEGSPGHMSYDELGEGFQRGLLSEARAAIVEAGMVISDIRAQAFEAWEVVQRAACIQISQDPVSAPSLDMNDTIIVRKNEYLAIKKAYGIISKIAGMA